MATEDARRRALEQFAGAFERGAYWDAHEHLEALWRADRIDLWQALIQIAAAFVLIGSQRTGGARSVLRRARAKLAPLPASQHRVDVAWVRRQCDALDEHLGQAAPPHTAHALFDGLGMRLGLVP